MQYWLFKALSRFLCLLPYQFVLSIGRGLGKLYYHIAVKQRKRAMAQIMRSLHTSGNEADYLARRMFNNIGKNFVEILRTPKLTKENYQDYIIINDLHHFTDALAKGHGVVLLTAHIGNWEWLGAALTYAGLPLSSVIKRQPNDQHTRLLNEYREMVGMEIFSRGTTELVGAAKALKKGRVLAFLADQDAGPGGAFIDFLGKPASTPLGPAVFAKRFKSPIVPVFMLRTKEGKHVAQVYEPFYYQDTGNEEQDLYALTEKMTKLIEEVIRQHPSQWMWFQKRWNTPVAEAKQVGKHVHVKKGIDEHE